MVRRAGGIYYPRVFMSFLYLSDGSERAIVGEETFVNCIVDRWGYESSLVLETVNFYVEAGVFARERGGIRLSDELQSCLSFDGSWRLIEAKVMDLVGAQIEKSFSSLNSAVEASLDLPMWIDENQLVSWVTDNCVGMTIVEMADKVSKQFDVPVEITTRWICQTLPKIDSTAKE